MISKIFSIFIMTLMMSFQVLAKAPLLDLNKLIKCPGSQTDVIPQAIQGEYGTLHSDPDDVTEVIIGDNGIQQISNWKEIVPRDKVYLTEEQFNEEGYCLEQKIEEQNGQLKISVNITKNFSHFLYQYNESNKMTVTFSANATPFYDAERYSCGRVVVLPACRVSFSGQESLVRLNH